MVGTGSPPSNAAPRPLCPLREAEAWIFDLDNTLYSSAYDLFAQIDGRMKAYIARFLGLDPEQAYRVQKQYFLEYGNSLRGLMQVHGMDPDPFLDHVHDIDVSVLPPSPVLEELLARLPGKKVVFTNASTRHAERVLDRLGIGHHFDAVFDIVEAGYQPKPEPAIYQSLIDRHVITPETTVMVEDMARNLAPAAALGMTTVWVRTGSEHGRFGVDDVRIDHVVEDMVAWLTGVVAGEF